MKHFLFCCCLSCLLSSPLLAGVYRHDVPVKAYKDLANEPQFDCAGEVLRRDGKKWHSTGSCVLVGDRFVLSAAHVFMTSDQRAEKRKYEGRNMTVYIPFNIRTGNAADYYFRFKGNLYRGRTIRMFPGYSDTAVEEKADLALIELERIVSDVLPARLNTAFDELHARVVGVGYGASGIASKPETVQARSERIAGENIADELSGTLYHGMPVTMKCDFDCPQNDKACSQMGDAAPLPLEYIPSGGDSGGGLFRETASGWELVGILSGGGVDIDRLLKTGYYGQTGEWTRVAVLHDWILQQMNVTGR